MANVPTTTTLITLAQGYRGDVVRNINRKCATVKMLRFVAGEGKNIAWAPESSGALTENYTEGQDATNFGGDAQASAFLGWSLYRSNFHVTKLAQDTAASSASPQGNKALWARQLANNAGALASTINGKLYTGPGTGTEMAGFEVAVADGNTYATIDRTSGGNAYFRSTVIDPGSPTEISFELIRDDLSKIYIASGETPNIAPVSPAVFNKVGALFDATRRQMESVMGPNGPVKLEFGFQALEVDGTVFFKDKDCTANSIYYLNTDYVEVQYLPDAAQAEILAKSQSVTPDDGFGEVPLGMSYEMLAKTGPADKAEVLWQGQLCVSRPNAQGVRKNVAVLG